MLTRRTRTVQSKFHPFVFLAYRVLIRPFDITEPPDHLSGPCKQIYRNLSKQSPVAMETRKDLWITLLNPMLRLRNAPSETVTSLRKNTTAVLLKPQRREKRERILFCSFDQCWSYFRDEHVYLEDIDKDFFQKITEARRKRDKREAELAVEEKTTLPAGMWEELLGCLFVADNSTGIPLWSRIWPL